jgi:oligoribonuclease NrnB/cAMP/cGMP phosphodiesterase (DHH superfamily)
MNDVLIIYHEVDFDGKCSAAIAAEAFTDCDFYGWGHYRDINWDLIEKYDTVVMVDISFPEEWMMERLDSLMDFIWIDHHLTSVEKYKSLCLVGKYEVGKGACQLCWEYFFPHLPIPKGVKLLADYDIWDHKDKDTLPFQYGMRYLDIQAEDFFKWKQIFNNDGYLINKIFKLGNICFNFQTSQNEYKAKSTFELEFEGHKCIALNGGGGSLVFESVNGREYDIMITFSYNSKYWTVSMYNDNGNVDVGAIAKKYGGGGHRQASGMQLATKQMIELGLIK